MKEKRLREVESSVKGHTDRKWSGDLVSQSLIYPWDWLSWATPRCLCEDGLEGAGSHNQQLGWSDLP
jgi:hypothetical protein